VDLETRIDRLEDALARLAEAQARTEERVGRLEDAVARLAEAQARTEVRLEALAQAQARTENALLALTQQVGRLAETIGFTLEDLAREVTPPHLARYHATHVHRLDRRFFVVDGGDVEIDLYGEGQQDGRPIVVIGEVRSRIYGRDVEGATRQAERLRPHLPAAPLVVLFGFVIHPSARAAAQRLGAIVISSSGRPEPAW
jgi:hypothetical protein